MKSHFFLIMILLAFLGSCKLPTDYIYSIDNLSDDTIYFYFAWGGTGGTVYPDTCLPIDKNSIVSYVEYRKKYNSSYSGSWEESFKVRLPKDTLSIYFLSKDTFDKRSWEEIRYNYSILKRYDLSLSDLYRLNFIIPYPPSPAMSRMKMYPAYK